MLEAAHGRDSSSLLEAARSNPTWFAGASTDTDTTAALRALGRRQVTFAPNSVSQYAEQLRSACADFGRGASDLKEAAAVPPASDHAQALATAVSASGSARVTVGTVTQQPPGMGGPLASPRVGSPSPTRVVVSNPTSLRQPSPGTLGGMQGAALRTASPASSAGGFSAASRSSRRILRTSDVAGSASPSMPGAGATSARRTGSPSSGQATRATATVTSNSTAAALAAAAAANAAAAGAAAIAGPERGRRTAPLCAWAGSMEGSVPRTPRDPPGWPPQTG